MLEKRSGSTLSQCSWCKQVRSGPHWVHERRARQTGTRINVICKRCRFFYFRGFDLEGFQAWANRNLNL